MTKAKRKPLTKKQYAIKWHQQDGKCGLSGKKMMFSDDVHEDHIVPVWAADKRGKIHWWATDEWIDVNDPRNIQLVLKAEHNKKTKTDTKNAAKDKRINGETKTGPKAKINSPGFKTNRDGEWKAKFGGGVERRD